MAGKKAHISKEKIQAVTKLAGEIAKANTIMLVSIKNLPSNQLQKMKKNLREKAEIQIAKKSMLMRAIDETAINGLEKMKEHIKEDCALLLSQDDAFNLAGWFAENKNPIVAKEGQIAENDIIIEEGPTELVPGPVISELGALGLQIMVDDGKITIKKSKVAIKKGDKVSGAASSIFQKLGIKPFMIGISPIAFFDKQSGKIYVDIKIDKKKTLADLINSKVRALGFSISVGYPSKDNISMLLGKANSQASALIKLNTQTQ